jgi:hypothetical protein
MSVGLVSWIVNSFTGGVGGVKMLSNLSDFPTEFLQLLIIAALVRVVLFDQSPD